MMRTALIVMLATLAWPSIGLAGGEIHGTVTTVDGDRHTGSIRWDKNENFWDDVIDVTKDDRVKVKHNGVDVKILGLHVRSGGGHDWTHSQFTIPFGHLRSIEPIDGRRVRLSLKNGDVLEVREGADMGPHMRGIAIAGANGEVALDWEDIDRVEFSSGSGDDRDHERLYGTVETSIGEFTGYIVWDKDESLKEDVLNGERKGRDRKIPFGEIQEIERISSRKARVMLASGKTVELSGTNDVDSGNRGIDITIADMGKVSVDWSRFRRVTFHDPPPSPHYDDFDGGRVLKGTVRARDGESWTGEIVWDKDERYTWEAIDGKIKGVEFEITFQYIAQIDRESRSSATVRLADGLEFRLRDSNDVNHENKGIVIRTDDGEEVTVDWDDFESAVFSAG